METVLIILGIVLGAWAFFNLGRLWESLDQSRRIREQTDV